MASVAPRLLAWFDAHGRHDLPWQRARIRVSFPLANIGHNLPTLWATLRQYDRDHARAVVQNFNLVILALSGSLREGSHNTDLLRGAAAAALADIDERALDADRAAITRRGLVGRVLAALHRRLVGFAEIEIRR